MALYLGNRQQSFLSAGLSLGGLVAMVGGGVLAWANPQLYDREVYENAWVSGRMQGSLQYQAPTDRRGQALGQTLMALGFVMGGGGIYLASGDPATLRPEAIANQPLLDYGTRKNGKTVGATDSPVIPEDAVMASLRTKIMHLVGANEWLRQCLMSPTIILVGDSGSGKSTVANAIAVLRLILWGWPISIFDPHATENARYGTWLTGHLYGLGGDPEGTIREGLTQAMKPFAPFAEDNKTRHTLICDEFTGWADGSYPGLAPIAGPALSHANRTVRKQGQAMIIPLHGDKKGTAGGEDLGSGILESVMRFGAVIKLDGKSDDWGNPCWSGTAKFKPPGKPYTDAEMLPIVIPDLIAPGRLRQEIGDLLEYLGYGLEDDQNPQAPSIPDDVRETVEAAFNADAFMAIAERMFKGTVDAAHHPLEVDPDWSVVRGSPELRSLLQFCRSKKWNPVEVDRVKGSWGKTNNANSRESIRALVDALIASGLAEWSARNTTGEGTEFRILPRWASWPSWLE